MPQGTLIDISSHAIIRNYSNYRTSKNKPVKNIFLETMYENPACYQPQVCRCANKATEQHA